MLTTLYYLLRSRKDGSYLAAHPQGSSDDMAGKSPDPGYLIMFQDYADGLSYLNAHAPNLAPDFAVESVSQTQLKGMMQRWQFKGVGLVTDPLLPKVEFMTR